jgi:pectinesterase
MKSRMQILVIGLAMISGSICAAEKLVVTVSHDLDIARPSETIAVPWSEVNAAIPRALIQRIAVKDAAGNVLAHQVTNIAPQAKDPDGKGVAYGELLFQHSFAAGEKSATFTVPPPRATSPAWSRRSPPRPTAPISCATPSCRCAPPSRTGRKRSASDMC